MIDPLTSPEWRFTRRLAALAVAVCLLAGACTEEQQLGPVEPRGHINAWLSIDSTDAWNAQLIDVGVNVRFRDEDRYRLGRMTGYRLALVYNAEIMHPEPAVQQFEAIPSLRKFDDVQLDETWRIVYWEADWSAEVAENPEHFDWRFQDHGAARALFRIAGDPDKIGGSTPVRFFMGNCHDNVLIFERGELPLANTASDNVVVIPGLNSSLCHVDDGGLYGTMGQLAITGPVRFTQGDLDLSGVSNGIDVVKFTNELFRGQSYGDPDPFVAAALLQAADVNRDQQALTIADFDMTMNLIFRGLDTNRQEPPYHDTLYYWLTGDSAGVLFNTTATAAINMMTLVTDIPLSDAWERLLGGLSITTLPDGSPAGDLFLRHRLSDTLVEPEPTAIFRVRGLSPNAVIVPSQASAFPGTLMAIVHRAPSRPL